MASAPEKHRITYGHVTDDIRDGAPVDATLKFHEDALAQMKAETPELHAEPLAEIGAD